MIDLQLGDCLDLLKDIPDHSVNLILCDLPYGMTHNKWDTIIDIEKLWFEYKRVLTMKGVVLLFGSEPFSSKLRMSNPKWYKYDWIWQKTSAVGFLNAHKRPLHCFENVCVFYQKQPLYHPQMRQGFKPYKKTKTGVQSTNYGHISGNKQSESKDGSRFPIDIITFAKDGKRIHPTQKPVALLAYLIKTYTNEGDKVLDNTMGSGSTGVACVHTQRDFIGMELNKEYFEMATNRIEEAKKEELQNETSLDL